MTANPDALVALQNMKANGFDLGLEEEDYLALDAAIEALAAAPKGVDVENLRKLAQLGKQHWKAGPGYYEEIISLIDSAGGAKGECCVPDAGEPSFVFLGRDPQAPTLIEQWADERERAEPDSTKPAAARDIARRMRKFKNANPDKGLPASAITPQPAEGDGVVYQWHEFAGRWEDFTKEQFDEVQASGEIVLGETIITPAMTRKLYIRTTATAAAVPGYAVELLTNIKRACVRGRSAANMEVEANFVATCDHIESLADQALAALNPEPQP